MNDLRNQLSESAHSFDVAEASSTDLQRRAHRRSQRSNVVKATAVLAVAGVGVYGVARLSDPGGDVIVTSASPDGASTSNGGAAGSTPNDASGATANDPFAGLPQTRAAEFIPGGYDWAAYRADSPEGLALRFDPEETYALGTSAGAIYETSVYKQTDGSWEPIAELGLLATDARTDDAIYAIKRDGDSEPAGEITRVDLASGAESSVAYPDGVDVAPQQVGRVTVHSTTTLAARGDMVALLVNHWVDIDPSAVELPDGWQLREVNFGAVFADREDCAGAGGANTVPYDTTDASVVFDPGVEVDPGAGDVLSETAQGMTSEPPLSRMPTTSDSQCQAIFPVDELQLTEQERAAIDSGSGLWTRRGDQWSKIELPESPRNYSLENPGVLGLGESQVDGTGWTAWVGDRYFAITDTDELQPLFGGNVIRQSVGFDVTTAGIASDTVTKVNEPYVLTQQIGSEDWHATDLRTLGVASATGPIFVNAAEASPLGDGGVFVDADIFTGFPTEPVELTSDSGEYTLSFPNTLSDFTEAAGWPWLGAWTVTNTATGELVDDVQLSTESGKIELLGNRNESVATFDADWMSVPALTFRNPGVNFVSSDGLRFRAIEHSTLTDATGLAEFGLNTAFRGVQQRGEQLILRNDGIDSTTGESLSYIFVGTPR